jgi:hypothetical protein
MMEKRQPTVADRFVARKFAANELYFEVGGL